MSLKARILSPAKVNLHLEIYPKRDDGFHSLLSVFQMVSLYDEIGIRSLTTADVCKTDCIDCVIEGDFSFPAEENIIWKCCRIFRRQTGVRTALAFQVRKRIPQGAGLGGGSSNGASVLRALNLIFETGLSVQKLAEMGSEAGSDIPFFCTAPAALVSGRGEFIKELVPRTDFFLVLVIPPLHIATAAAYGWLDAAGTAASPALGRDEYIKDQYEKRGPERWDFFNSFYPVLREKSPVFEEIRGNLLESGALYANISGSGSAMFGLFRDENGAREAQKRLKNAYPATEFLSPLAGMPELILQ
ncbi:MAG: 4-(cytidine 5'-diphospho)-2-C-methyl-D-erythritol kinase [Spirochaetales bacterium]|jgi:4-diphosphocytidyl-2-C-methyl-D-erythritol kinase|nr:4-(cytidine 5'-diphospho)-2-C-methyl-D-erythritol kinase [Spirochaetales bacterium]